MTGEPVETATTDAECHAELIECIRWLADRVDAMDARIGCQRCMTPAPPLPRYGHDARARDERPPHSCGRPGGAR
jgi:hypothetical protein